MKLNLSEFFIHLIEKKSFYGRLASSLQRVAKPGLGTMAVGIRDGRAVLFYDPAFLVDLSLNAGMFVLEHEMLHLVLDHIPRYLELLSTCPTDIERAKAAAVYNVSMDCAINNLLRDHVGFVEAEQTIIDRVKKAKPDLPEDTKAGMCLPEKFDLPMDGSFESYQYLLMRKVQVHKVSISIEGPSPHDYWTKGDQDGEGKGKGNSPGQGQGDGTIGDPFAGQSADELLSQANRVREQIKETLRSVVRSMGGLGRGTVPGNVAEFLEDYLKEPIIPWWEIFMTRARMSRMSKFQRSVKMPNRSLLALAEEDDRIIPHPGRVRDRSWRIFVMVDTSGSMSTDSLEIMNSELNHMLAVDEGMEIRYMQGDCTVQSDVLLKHGDTISSEVHGRGGTDFTEYFKYMRKYVDDDQQSPDLVVVYTDGYAPPVAPEFRLPIDIPVLWLVTPQHSDHFHDSYGEIIVCDPTHNEHRK